MADVMGVKLVVEAENRARAILDEYGRTLVDLSDKADRKTRALVALDQQSARTARSVRNLALPFVNELSPAMSSTTLQITQVISGAASLSTGLVGLGLAAAGVAGIIVGQLVKSFQEAKEKKEAWDRALGTGNVAKLTEEISKQSDEVHKLARAYQDAASARRAIDPRIERQLIGPGSPGARERAAGAALEQGAAGIAGQQRLLDQARFNQALVDAERDVENVNAQNEQARIDRIKRETAEAKKLAEALAEAQKQRDLERRREADVRAGAIGGEEARAFDPALLEANRQRQFRQEEQEREQLRKEAEDAAERARDRQRQLDVALSGEDESKAFAADTRDILAVSASIRERMAAAAAVEARAAEALLATSREQQLQLSLSRIELEKAAIAESERLLPAEKAAATYALQAEAAAKVREHLEHIDAAAGLARAAQEVGDEWSGVGQRIGDTFRGMAVDLQQTLADVLSGDAIGKDFGRDFLRSIQRTFAQEASKLIVGTLVNSFRGALGGALQIPLPGSGGLDVTGAPVTVLAGLQQQGAQLIGTAAGRTIAVTPGGGSGSALISSPAALQAGARPSLDYIGHNLVSEMEGSDFGATGNLPVSGGGGANYVGGALGLAATGLTLASGYDAASRGTDQGAATSSMAITGALAGVQAYSSILALGGGAAAGAVGGFAVFAVAAALGHIAAEEASIRKNKLLRRAARRQQAGDIVEQITNTVNNPQNGLRDMLSNRIIVRAEVAPVRIILGPRGPQNERNIKSVTGPSTGGLLMALANVRGFSEMVSFLSGKGYSPEGIDVEHDLGISDQRGWVNSAGELAASIDDIDGFLSDVFGKLLEAQESEQQERAAPFALVDTGYGVTRTTYLASAFLDSGLPGVPARGERDFVISKEYYRDVLGLNPNQIDRLVREFGSWTVKRDMPTDVSRRRFLEAF